MDSIEVTEGEGRHLDPTDHVSIDYSEAHGTYVFGKLCDLLALKDEDDDPVGGVLLAPFPNETWTG